MAPQVLFTLKPFMKHLEMHQLLPIQFKFLLLLNSNTVTFSTTFFKDTILKNITDDMGLRVVLIEALKNILSAVCLYFMQIENDLEFRSKCVSNTHTFIVYCSKMDINNGQRRRGGISSVLLLSKKRNTTTTHRGINFTGSFWP